jgi:NAD(P)-dependent dehydrogenase (short-subunit alcohol dehydrogenase family)
MKIVLITGATGGIGLEICKKFKKDNWEVVGTSLDKNYKSEFIDMYISKDLSLENSPKEILDLIDKKYGRLDCLINNAACQICKPIWEMSLNEWDMIYNVNVRSIFLFVKYGLQLLKKNKGNIINLGSVHSIVTSDKIASYASSKASIVGLTKNLAIELSKFEIRVNCISPGAVDTKMLRDGLLRGHSGSGNITKLIDNLAKMHLLKRVGSPKDIANFVHFISDNKNSFINGSNLIIDGGAHIKLSTE